jgi:hypothetical protein
LVSLSGRHEPFGPARRLHGIALANFCVSLRLTVNLRFEPIRSVNATVFPPGARPQQHRFALEAPSKNPIGWRVRMPLLSLG